MGWLAFLFDVNAEHVAAARGRLVRVDDGQVEFSIWYESKDPATLDTSLNRLVPGCVVKKSSAIPKCRQHTHAA